MTCSEIISAHEAPTRKVFMRGDLVCNKDMVVIVNHPTFPNGDVFHGTIFRGVIIYSKEPTTWSQNIGIEHTFWKEDAHLYIGTVTLEND